ncbi:hypothetical protein BLA29_006106 [Euroglyphus maynei]|uniref:Uncharacterized protein n=1 Tax=Euroglyphus maynei TaxID=6958 RepID=A0A1Y3BKU4_EURMA|nr:hypothetical protein BLA29_006106 [Euroglyphus maynei]
MKNSENSEQIYWSKSNIVIIISIIYLTIVMICVAIYLRKIDKRYRLLKFQDAHNMLKLGLFCFFVVVAKCYEMKIDYN